MLCCLWMQISGRTSVDIIKSGGYKLSALDIESTLLQHPQVAETAVLGVPDDQLGQVVTALVYPKAQNIAAGSAAEQEQLVSELKQLCADSLASYSIPRKWLVLDAPLPRNAMGKVNKKEMLREYGGQLQQA
jgi:malonyl-CoA/methylmalonyl-CoA synthetase